MVVVMTYLVSPNLFDGTESSCYFYGRSKLQIMILSPVPGGDLEALMYSYQNNQGCLEAKELRCAGKKKSGKIFKQKQRRNKYST